MSDDTGVRMAAEPKIMRRGELNPQQRAALELIEMALNGTADLFGDAVTFNATWSWCMEFMLKHVGQDGARQQLQIAIDRLPLAAAQRRASRH